MSNAGINDMIINLLGLGLEYSDRTWATTFPADALVLTYRKTSNISRTLEGNKIVDNSDVVGASPVGAAPTTFSFST